MLFSYADVVGNSLVYTIINDNGTRSHYCTDFIPDLKNKKALPIRVYRRGGSISAVDGAMVAESSFNTIADAKGYISNNRDVLYGQTDLIYQFLSHNFDGILPDHNKFKHLNIDIENEFDRRKKYDRNDRSGKILSIAIEVSTRKKHKYILGYHPSYTAENVTYIHVFNEKAMLSKLVEIIRDEQPDFITGWNVNRHDIAYIFHRMREHKLPVGMLSPYYWADIPNKPKSLVTINKDGEVTIHGITIFDYLDLYKKYTFKNRPSYKLDYIAELHTGLNKVDYKELGYRDLMDLYERNPDLFYEYNGHDVHLVSELNDVLQYLNVAITMAYMASIRFEDVYSQIRFWDTYIYKELDKEGVVIPPNTRTPKQVLEGAYVKDVLVGLWKWIASFDIESLYPNLIRSWNMSSETLIKMIPRAEAEAILRGEQELGIPNACVAANGAVFRTDVRGIVPRLIEKVFLERKHYRTLEKEAKKMCVILKDEGKQDTDEYKKHYLDGIIYGILQMVRKIAINSLYGIHGSEYFRYYRNEIAEAITITGQFVIKHIANHVNQFLSAKIGVDRDRVIGIDTDSNYFYLGEIVDKIVPKDYSDDQIADFIDKFSEKVLQPEIAKAISQVTTAGKTPENTIFMKRESIARAGIWRAKKNYAMHVIDDEGTRYHTPKLKVTGLESVKSSTPKKIQKWLESGYSMILNGASEKEVIDYMLSKQDEYKQIDLDQIALVSSVNMDKANTGDLKGASPWVKGSILFNKLIESYHLPLEPINSGDKVRYFMLNKFNKYREECIAFPAYLPDEFGLTGFIDRDKQFVKSFSSPLSTVADCAGMGIVPDKLSTSGADGGLMAFF